MRILASLAYLFAVACATTPPSPVETSADPTRVQVMVLGTWHFAGSSTDIASARTDSVLTPRRQQELDVVVERLAAFRPNVIVTERQTAAPNYVDPKYAEFSPADLLTNANERVQIAYRLAAKTRVERVYGVDEQPAEGEPDYFPFQRLMEHAAATGQGGRLEKMIAEIQAMVAAEAEKFSSLSMADALIEANVGKLGEPDFYFEILDFDVGEAQPAAELNAYWFMRNAKIFSKLIDVTKPGDRVVVVFGAGHKFWLDHLVAHTPGFERVDPVDYLREN